MKSEIIAIALGKANCSSNLPKPMYSSQFLYCRNCNFKTYHRPTLKYDWGYSCDICGTWQHQCMLTDIQQGYAAKIIQDGLTKDEIKWCNGTLEELIEAAHALNLEYDYQHTDDGFDFMAWSLENEEQVAKIKL
ncbi:hypothetical protein [Brunnivagina elsteri]|uniref:Uncharacterized protein n=1 Tax=Brunnivagina elsteri CCALA 953 TaxID=987040 RepID=A0A2A2TJM4_9CYAN|nr:hypothetical protein [Calothrix elsteri]PAX54881.1 hypothetical protein CK510_11890 [Calothrix elsteri CCALA 953]